MLTYHVHNVKEYNIYMESYSPHISKCPYQLEDHILQVGSMEQNGNSITCLRKWSGQFKLIFKGQNLRGMHFGWHSLVLGCSYMKRGIKMGFRESDKTHT